MQRPSMVEARPQGAALHGAGPDLQGRDAEDQGGHAGLTCRLQHPDVSRRLGRRGFPHRTLLYIIYGPQAHHQDPPWGDLCHEGVQIS